MTYMERDYGRSLKDFIGLKVASLRINPNKNYLILEFKNNPIRTTALHAYGECCSSSWIEHMSGVDSLIGGTITAFEEINMSDLNGNTEEFDYTRFYGYKFTTNKGTLLIEMRNSSNGYYGGELEIVSPKSHEHFEHEKFTEVKEDF